MSSHFQNSGPQSNAYSESKSTNWTKYDPFFAEVRAAYKRFDSRLSLEPKFSHIVTLRPATADFIHPCDRVQVERRLRRMPPDHLVGLRAVFILGGTQKQLRSWGSSVGIYGCYWRRSVFLCAYPFGWYRYINDVRDFYLNDTLVHEVAHHVDRFRTQGTQDREAFAEAFVEQTKRDFRGR